MNATSRLYRTRYIILAIISVLTLGSLATTGGFACYLRSDSYRRACAERLSAYLKLPADIGRVVPRSSINREFENITVFLPNSRGKALSCERAIVYMRPTLKEPDAYEVELIGGACELSNRTWLKEDYRRVLESGLRPSFDPDGPERVQFSGMDITFSRDDFHLRLDDANGAVSFAQEHAGHAVLGCRKLNGNTTPEPVTLNADFSPAEGGVQVDQLELRVPRLPLSLLRLGDLFGTPIEHGDFDGRLTYSEAGGPRQLTASGACFNILLSEWTRPFMPVAWRGNCAELELLECRIVDRVPARIRFRGALSEVNLGDILHGWGLGDMGGQTTLRVGEADLTTGGIQRLVISGQCRDISLDSLSRTIGWGEMTGTARIVIDDLTIVNNRIASLDARVTVDEPATTSSAPATANRISGRLVREVVARALKVNLPPMLPENIEYAKCGVRIDIRDEVMRVFGTHGDREKTILTVRLFGRDFQLLFEPADPIDLTPHMNKLRETMLPQLNQRLYEFSRRARPATQPAQ